MKPHLIATISWHDSLSGRRKGFTLIEMLVSVALVLLMMVMFAEIFGLAAESMGLQRAIGDNDQQVRTLTTVIRADLQKRTFRVAAPFDPLETEDYASVPFSSRPGYLYLSLNDPDNAVDNLLQFTVRSTINLQNGDETPYYGRATGLVQNAPQATDLDEAKRHIRRNSQQPEHDDGEIKANFAGASTAAEIAYYVRAGRLYRRVILIRDPISVGGASTPQPRFTWDEFNGQVEATPIEYFRHIQDSIKADRVQTFRGQYLVVDPGAPATSNTPKDISFSDDYWKDFSYSAVATFSGGKLDGASMLDLQALDNSGGSTSGALGLIRGPGATCSRFGFDQFTGISREFSSANPADAGFFFLGRYTAEEMSHIDFNFPQNFPADDNGDDATLVGFNPMSYDGASGVPVLQDALPAFEPDGVVDVLAGGDRRGEDLLLSNVHAFEIDVWDDRLNLFVQLGHSLSVNVANPDTRGDYHVRRNNLLNAGFGIVPGDTGNWDSSVPSWVGRTFDTWHRANQIDLDGDKVPDPAPAPYRALTYYPLTAPGPHADGVWEPDHDYMEGDIVFPDHYGPRDFSFYYVCARGGLSRSDHEDIGGDGTSPSEDSNGNGTLDGNTIPGDKIFTEDRNDNGTLDLLEDTDLNGTIDDDEPFWPTSHRSVVEPRSEDANNNGMLDGNTTPRDGIFTEDLNDNGTLDVEPRWVAQSNLRPLKAIRIRVRFFHVASGSMRQVSLIHSLID
jgi:prepilin-type N-terminal cleavage/methylation domain-containing protein